ncbi:MAG: hypothetical protein WHS46_11570 [Desulfosoma sp.]
MEERKRQAAASELQLQPITSSDQSECDDTGDVRVSAKSHSAFQRTVSRVLSHEKGPMRKQAGGVQHLGKKADESILGMWTLLSELDTQSPGLLPPQVGADGCASVLKLVCLKTTYFLGSGIVQKEEIKIQSRVARGKRRYRSLGRFKEFCAEVRDKAHENVSLPVKAVSQGFLRRDGLDGRLLEPVVFSNCSGDFKEALLLVHKPQGSRNDIVVRNPRAARNFPVHTSENTRPVVDEIAQEDETRASLGERLPRVFDLNFFEERTCRVSG